MTYLNRHANSQQSKLETCIPHKFGGYFAHKSVLWGSVKPNPNSRWYHNVSKIRWETLYLIQCWVSYVTLQAGFIELS